MIRAASYRAAENILDVSDCAAYAAGVAARSTRTAFAGFLFGASGMFATMYSTQAILPRLSRSFDVSPSAAGLTISVLVLAVAVGAWIWGPVSDRIGGRRSLLAASTIVVIPVVAGAL